ncbi:SH3 domain-containing protein [Roseivirga sp. E12]|uniref:SH3 domain-containing protein n=1 Tax=Roseivirga sp. E12 TaxID=2819237 RepID=UPI001ABCD0D4|nr:SH3 domain-containing protein [Roseivirga sp. E12]MBO3699122.1 SH3 domain-containing protein [Roseivirga sp. E12]
MQKRGSKFILLFILGVIFFSQVSYSQDVTNELSKADSLFRERMYTQSLEIYESIYTDTQRATPAMLLKMAYSQEAMGNLSNALVYLHDYYRVTSDKGVLKKMSDLAQVNGLEGYGSNDFQRFVKTIQDFKLIIIAVLLALCLLILSMIFRKIKKHNEKSPGLAVGFVLVLALAVFFVNFSDQPQKGIVTSSNSYVMSGPSAAAELIEVVGQGHKVEILDKTDIWYEIMWKGKRAFVRETNLQELL